ncbi:MAG: S8 family serine peptidase [Bacteroidota bacterium]
MQFTEHLQLILFLTLWSIGLQAQTNPFLDFQKVTDNQIVEYSFDTWFEQAEAPVVKLFTHQLADAAQREQLAKKGIHLMSFRSDGSYIAMIEQSVRSSELQKNGFYRVEKYKLNNDLTSGLDSQLATRNTNFSDAVFVALTFLPGTSPAQCSALIQQAGLELTYAFEDMLMYFGNIHPRQLDQLRQSHHLLRMSILPDELSSFTDDGQKLHQINVLHGELDEAYSLKGDGVVIGVGDIGDVSNHIDLQGKIIRVSDGLKYHEHSEHVVGILAGQANLSENYGGVAPEGQILLGKNFDIIAQSMKLNDQYGMAITNNSYGRTFYCDIAENIREFTLILDKQLHEIPALLHVFSAGNFGDYRCEGQLPNFQTLSPVYGVAKNVLTVGNIDIDGKIAANSSRGPTLDGRLKPEICAKGVQTFSTAGGKGYTTKSGTSMAAPLVTGTSALLTQAYRLENNGENPDGGLIKAILCNTAVDKGLPGPDFTYGFGLMNARRAFYNLEQKNYRSGQIANGQTLTFPLNVDEQTNQLKVLLYWADKENAENILFEPALINNLDIEVVAADGSIHLPYVAQATQPDQAAIRAVDQHNNIEQVVIDLPKAGNYTIRVKGSQVPFGPQQFYLSFEQIQPEVVLTSPVGKEQLTPQEETLIVWDADPLNDKTFKLEYSLDNGLSWSLIDAAVAADQRTFQWSVPTKFTEQGRIRISKNGASLEDQNETPFYILDRIETIDAAFGCDGVLRLNWEPSQTASAYEVLRYENGQMTLQKTVSTSNAILENLDYTQNQWVSIRPVTASGIAGIRAETKEIFPGLPQPNIFEIEQAEPISCAGADDGVATVVVSDPSKYDILWDNGENGPTAFSLSAGQHEVTLTDQLGCSSTATVNFSAPEPLAAVVQTQAAHAGKADGSAHVEVNGGTAPYTYYWSTAVSSTSHEWSNLEAGTYEVTIIDDRGCELIVDFLIDQLTSIAVLDSPTTGSLNVYPNPSHGRIQIDWTGLNASETRLQLFDLSGKLLRQEIVSNSNQLSIERNWSDLPAGKYILKLENGNQHLSRPWIKIE